MTDRNKGQPIAPQTNQKALQSDLLYLSTYIKRCPYSIQKQLLPYCFELRKEYPSDEKIEDLCNLFLGETQIRPQTTPNSQTLIRNLFRILQLKVLPSTFSKIIDRIESQRVKPLPKSKQQIISKNSSFQRVDTIYPDYDIYYKMSKQERQHYLPNYNPRTQFKEYYTEPRLIVRLDQLLHFRSNQKLKGDILFLHYEGNIITGGKSYAVANDKRIQVWEMTSDSFPTPRITPIVTDAQQNDQKKDEEERKQREAKIQIPQGTKFSLNNVYNGHIEKITSLSFSLDELYLVSGSLDRTIKLWCLRLKICLCTFRGHRKTIWDVHFSPSGYYILSGSADGLMILWKSDVPLAQKCFDHRSDVYKVSFARDPNIVISAGQDGNIKMWRILQADLIRVIKLNRPVINMNLGLTGSLLVGVENDGRITIFNLLKGEIVNSFYFYEDKKGQQSSKNTTNKMRVHDVCLSEDQREITCVTSKYIVIYSMDRLEMKVTNNIFTFFQSSKDSSQVTKLPPKEIIYMGIETNLTFCKYQHKNLLVVAGNGRT